MTILRRQSKQELRKTGCGCERKVQDDVKIFALSNMKDRASINKIGTNVVGTVINYPNSDVE